MWSFCGSIKNFVQKINVIGTTEVCLILIKIQKCFFFILSFYVAYTQINNNTINYSSIYVNFNLLYKLSARKIQISQALQHLLIQEMICKIYFNEITFSITIMDTVHGYRVLHFFFKLFNRVRCFTYKSVDNPIKILQYCYIVIRISR